MKSLEKIKYFTILWAFSNYEWAQERDNSKMSNLHLRNY